MALADPSPLVRIVAAQALAQFGEESDLRPALDCAGRARAAKKAQCVCRDGRARRDQRAWAEGVTAGRTGEHDRAERAVARCAFDPYVPRLIAEITGAAPAQVRTSRGRSRRHSRPQKALTIEPKSCRRHSRARLTRKPRSLQCFDSKKRICQMFATTVDSVGRSKSKKGTFYFSAECPP